MKKLSKLNKFGIMPKKGRKFEELAYLIGIVYNSTRAKLEEYLRKRGLSLAKFNILSILKYVGGDGGMSQTDITKSLIISDGNITGVLDRMEKENLLIRFAYPGDRRVNLVRITLKGSDMLESLWPGYEEILQAAVSPIPPAKQDMLVKIFYNWADKLI
jgi:MarR family 2-MHQ and catechol resistance regulon transcriptional repressor